MALNLARTVKAGDADPKVVQILTECLEFDTITENQAARRIDEYNKLDEDQYNLEDIWGAFFRASFHIPHDHPAQSRLVQILLELKELPSRTVQFGDKELIFWSGMPLFHGYFSEWWQFCGPFDRPMDEEGKSPEEIVEEASHEWQNFVSFSARLWKAGLIGLFRSSVYTLREALEDDTGELELKWRIAAASEWIVHCGPLILEEIRDNDFIDAGTPPKGPLYDGEGKTESYRWEFWKRRFEEVSCQLEGDFKTLALDCASRMKQISDSLD